jgi:DNA invertase Pin-like site-specific DNA recombinase
MMGRLFLTLIASIAELESDLIRERVRAGMRRARMEGRQKVTHLACLLSAAIDIYGANCATY